MTSCHLPAATFEGWAAQVAELYGIEGDVDTLRDTEVVLDLVRDVGRVVARPAGPLTVFLLGVAAGRAASAGTAVTPHVEELARQARELAHQDGERAGANEVNP